MYAFYLMKGHSLESLTGLSTAEKLFYMAAFEVYSESNDALIGEING